MKKGNLNSERRDWIMEILLEMYIANGWRMPTNKQIKKNPNVSKKDVDILRSNGTFTEANMRRLAKEASGRDHHQAQEVQQRARDLQATKQTETVKLQDKPKESQSIPKVAGPQNALRATQQSKIKMAEPAKKRGRKGVSYDEVLADLQALAARLGRTPTTMDIRDKSNGAKYSNPTYVDKLGPKSGWTGLLEAKKQGKGNSF